MTPADRIRVIAKDLERDSHFIARPYVNRLNGIAGDMEHDCDIKYENLLNAAKNLASLRHQATATDFDILFNALQEIKYGVAK